MATTLKVEEGALVEVPCFSYHKRGKNWCAKIWRAADKPGGLGWEFWGPALGDFYRSSEPKAPTS